MSIVSNGVDKVNDTLSSVISVASNKKEFIGKQIINALLLFVILLVFGCLDFATLRFHFEYLADLNYWVTVGSKAIAGICAFNIGINLLWESELKKDQVLSDAIATYKELVSRKQLDFEHYVVHIYNPTEKKKAYISQINKKIHLLNKFSRAKDRLLYSSELEERQEEKLKNRYCIRRKELEDLKNPTFIEKNLDSLKVKYSEIDPSVFDLEIDGSVTYTGKKVKGNVGAAKLKATSSMVLGMVAFSMFVTSIGLEVNQEEFEENMVAFWHYLLKCCEDVGIVLWQVFRGMLKVRSIISSEYTKPFTDRIDVLTKYLEWRLTTNQPDSKIYTELHKDESVEEIELTEEQYNALQTK